MTALLDRELTPDVGSMTPRVFTPPLEHHCTGPAPDPFLVGAEPEECPCGCGLNPVTSWGFACNQFAKDVLRWKMLPYQQWLNIHALEKDDKTGGFRFKIIVVLIARQQGKALDCDTPMLTTNGWSTMGALKVGDEVFHVDGTPTRVIGAFDQPAGRTCYEVTTTDGRSIVADAEHLWTVQDVRRCTRKGRAGQRPVRTYPWETLTTTELLSRGLARDARGRERAFRLPTQGAIQSKPVDLAVDPYILGTWLGDGTGVAPIISVGDQDAPEMVDNLLAAGAQLISVKRGKTCWSVRINVGGGMRDGFEARCRQLGIWGAKAIPPQYLTAGTEQRLALLQGLLDTDGSISDDGQVEFCSTNRNLADGVHYLARSLGFRPGRICEATARLKGRDIGPKYRVRFTPDTEGPIPFRLARKAERIKTHPMRNRGRQAVSIESIREVESRPVRCIKVDREDGLFLAGRDLVPTHNTYWLKALGLWRLFINRVGRADARGPGARLALIAAQNLQYAEGVLKEVVEAIRENPGLSKELVNHRVTNGNHRAILSNKRYWRAATASRKGGRSLAVDLAQLDELREHTTSDAWDAIAPTTLVRPFSQVVCTSNAGDHRSEVLRSLRDPAIRRITTGETADTKTGLFEWSVPDNVDPREDKYWHMANPALGHLNDFSLVDLRAMFEAMQYRNLPGFQTEHLALDVTTPVLTTDGWKTMETIAVGDQVFHPDGHPIDVTHITPVYTNRDCYEVKTTDGRTVVCDTEHQWMVNDRRSNRGWEALSTGELVSLGLTRNKGGGGKYAFRLPNQRIHTRPSRAGERTTVSIRSITPVASRPVRCITVGSDDSLWLAGPDLLPTRNCMWVDALEPGIIPAEHWAETRHNESRRKAGSPIYAALDVNYQRSRSFIAIAARRDDGNLHIEIVNGARGTDWVIPWLSGKDPAGVDRREKFAGVAVQKTGAPASGMIDDMRRAGIPVVEWGPGLEVAGASGAFYDAIVEHKIFHKPSVALDRAAASGISRNVGEGWVFDRRNSPVDVSPVIACAAAMWLEHQIPAAPPDIHEWPDEETLAAWEAAAEEKFNAPPQRELNDIEGNTWWTT